MKPYLAKLFSPFALTILIVGWLTYQSIAAATGPATAPVAPPPDLFVKETINVPFASEMTLSPDGAYLYVLQRTNTGNESAVVAISTTTYQTQTISLGAGLPMGLAFVPDGSELWVAISRQYLHTTSPGSNRVTVIDPFTGSIITTLLTGNTNPYGPTQVAIVPDGTKAYVTNRGPHRVHDIAIDSKTINATFAVNSVPMALAITPDGSRLYTMNRLTNDLAAINLTNNSIITKISLSLPAGDDLNSIALNSNGTRAYVVYTSSTDVGSSNIAVVNIDPGSPTYHQQIATWATSGASLSQVIVTPDDQYLLVTSRGTDELLVIDINTANPTYGTQIGQLTVGDQPASVVYHDLPGIVGYVANYGDGTVSVIGYQEAITGLTAANDSPTVIGSSTTLTATITTGEHVQYTWSFGDGSYGSGITLTHTYPAFGVYTAVVTATNQVSQMTATTTVNVIDLPIAGLTASNSSPTIVGNQTFFAAATLSGSNVQYSWAFGDGIYGSGTNPTHIYPAAGNYTAIVTATNSNNTMSATTLVQVIDIAISGLAAANDSPTILGSSTHLTATITSGSNVQYSWAFGDGSYGSGANPTHIYPAVGNYTAIVTATNSNNSMIATTLVTIEAGISYAYLPMISYCRATPLFADIALVIDTSGSMADPTEPGGPTKLAAAQTAAATFLDFLDFSGDQAAVISFDDIARLNQPLTNEQIALLTAINGLQLGNLTRMDLALHTARLELTGPRHNPDNQMVIIFLTDGYPNGTTAAQVLAQADLAKNAGITIYTIGLGTDINANLLAQIASAPSYYYPSPSTNDLNAIYAQIASSFACR